MDHRSHLSTSFTERLGLEFPIMQSGMSGVAGAEVAAAVSGAGGLGVVSGVFQPPDALREAIADVRSRTDAPFGINLLFAPGLVDPVDPAGLSPELTDQATTALNDIRADLGLDMSSLPANCRR